MFHQELRQKVAGPLAIGLLLLGACEGAASPDTQGDPATGGSEPAGAGGRGAGGTVSPAGGKGAVAGASGGEGGEPLPTEGALRDHYDSDLELAKDPAVLFFDDFESGWGRWGSPSEDTEHLTIQSLNPHAGTQLLRSKVTLSDLGQNEYISASPRFSLPKRVQELYLRYYARFTGLGPTPHHWVRFAAGTEAFQSSGLANTVPDGNQGFWFDFDVSTASVFDFYAYWFGMRSGRCNDGSTTPGCAGDQGTTYHYGNVFQPASQTPFARDEWLCIEIQAKANTIGQSDGELAFWINDTPVGRYAPGTPEGTWLRESFHEGGCEFSACTPPEPFEGFEFRLSDDVLFKEFFLDSYYQLDTFQQKQEEMRQQGLNPSDEAIIDYDDLIAATERIGCQRELRP
jgi:hypothetical protein